MADQNKPQQQQQQKASPFGVVSCERPQSASVSERFGRKSIATIIAHVPITAVGMVVDVTIWGRLKVDADKTEISFEASVPKGMRIPESADMERFLAHVETSALAWAGYDSATDSAVAKLLGQASKSDSQRPRLVKAVKAAAA